MIDKTQTKEMIAKLLKRRSLFTITPPPMLIQQEPPKPLYTKGAIVFDIDGVLLKGKTAIPEAIDTLKVLGGQNEMGKRIPFLLLTNGGGVSEEEKAKELSKTLDFPIMPEQVILSHTPMKALVPEYKDKLIMVVGGKNRSCVRIAKMYGFTKVCTPNDVYNWNKAVWPFMDAPPQEELPSDPEDEANADYSKEKIHAVMIFHDPRDYGRDLQIVYDVLKSKDGILGNGYMDSGEQSVPLYCSNADLIWSNDFVSPRFGQGAFHVCLHGIWDKTSGNDQDKLEKRLFGKPFQVQYEFAEKCLDKLISSQAGDSEASTSAADTDGVKRNVYAIGDNPLSDIDGAHNYGWNSVLVRTGVYTEATKHKYADSKPTQIVDNVGDAIKWILENEAARED
ncbi:hypothetical protein H4219_002028 [Mycoemilia scoparia]|uniref:Uncharacterized protein n=1 Tax=Mycoemilia scoparia TaxID=417184 RepID=A0A9W7ZYN5_9FUNG|nr:hypothetical protein H4219_002028 [Mycoemilia scoparia]